MRSQGGCVLRWGLAIGLLVGKSHAQAQQSPTTGGSQFAYSSPAQCPGRDVFVERVGARQSSRSGREVAEALNELLSQVVVQTTQARGVLYFRDPRVSPRKVTASSCDEVVTGLALIAGLALDVPTSLPEVVASESAAPKSVVPEPATPSMAVDSSTEARSDTASARDGAPGNASVGAELDKGASMPEAKKPDDASPNAAHAGPSRAAQRSSGADTSRGSSGVASVRLEREAAFDDYARGAESRDDTSSDGALEVGFGVAAGMWTALSRPELRADGFFELANRPHSWATRIGVFGAWSEATAANWSADWATYGARLEGCPIWGGRGWHVGACALAEVGGLVVHGKSSVGDQADDARLLWADAGVGVRVGSPLDWRVNVEAQLDAVAPLTRYSFTFMRPAASLAHVPTAAVMLRLGFALRSGTK